jgi:hypothetical protein
MEDYLGYTYDKEYFNSLNLFEKYKYIKNMVNTIVLNRHNKEKENSRYKYHLYSDGTILMFDYTTKESSIMAYECINPNVFFTFPCIGDKKGDTFAILSDKECMDIRLLMDELFLQC